MASEGATSNIANIMLLYYLAIFLYSMLAHKVCGAGLWTVCLYYFAGMVAFYVWHLMAHSKWTGKMNDIHMRHHVYTYPPSKFYGRTPTTIREELGKDCPTFLDLLLPNKTITMQVAHEGPLYFFMAAILAVGYVVCGSSVPTLCMVLMLYVAMGLIGNAMHMSFHVKGFELERYSWYLELRTLHYLHHLGDMKSNLAMINLGMDGAMGSLAVSADSLHQPALAKKKQSDSGLSELMKMAELPYGITQELLVASSRSVGLIAASLGFDVPLDIAGQGKLHRPAFNRGFTTLVLRVIIVGLCAKAWRSALGVATQSDHLLLPRAGQPDLGQEWLAHYVTPHLFSNPAVVALACRASDIITNVSLVSMVVSSVVGSTFRPFLSVMIANVFRHIIHQVGPVPAVSASMSTWVVADKGSALPALGLLLGASDPTAFFSLRVCLSVIALTEVLRAIMPGSQNGFDALRFTLSGQKVLRSAIAVLGYLNVLFQVVLALCTRSSFTFDVIIAFVVGRYATLFASMHCSQFLDAFMP